MRTYQNEHNMLLNFPRCLSILLLQTSKTDNNALDMTLFITSNLVKHNLIQQTVDYQIKCKISMTSHYAILVDIMRLEGVFFQCVK
jgi:hypothetical protein